MSHAHRPTTARIRLIAGLLATAVGVGMLAGCSSGQITQTDTQTAAINGGSGVVGAIALRDVQLASPDNAQNVYQPGSTADVLLTIANTGGTDDQLVQVSSPVAEAVTINGSIDGKVTIPAGYSIAAVAAPAAAGAPATSATGSPSSTASAGPAASPSLAPTQAGTVVIQLIGIKSINGGPLRTGLIIPITFVFAHAGQVTVQVSVAVPSVSSAG